MLNSYRRQWQKNAWQMWNNSLHRPKKANFPIIWSWSKCTLTLGGGSKFRQNFRKRGNKGDYLNKYWTCLLPNNIKTSHYKMKPVFLLFVKWLGGGGKNKKKIKICFLFNRTFRRSICMPLPFSPLNLLMNSVILLFVSYMHAWYLTIDILVTFILIKKKLATPFKIRENNYSNYSIHYLTLLLSKPTQWAVFLFIINIQYTALVSSLITNNLNKIFLF